MIIHEMSWKARKTVKNQFMKTGFASTLIAVYHRRFSVRLSKSNLLRIIEIFASL